MRASAPARRKVPDLVALKKEMTDKGVLLTSAELTPSSHGKRTTWRAGSRKITDGPFAESKEFIAGFWIVDVKDADEAYRIAANVSTCPGPGGKPLNMPIEVRAIGKAPA
jgi:hypothetical protein